MTFTVARDSQQLQLQCTPEPGGDGNGRIGVQLVSNTFIQHTYAKDAAEVVSMAQSEFTRWGRFRVQGLGLGV